MTYRTRSTRGFTLIELMIVATIIGMLMTVALPALRKFQLRSKTSEVKTNLAGLMLVEEAYFTESGSYLPATPEPPLVPGPNKTDFVFVGSDFERLGWAPEGQVYFSYGVNVTPNAVGFTIDAGADLDGDGQVQYWGYTKPDGGNNVAIAQVGCDVTLIDDRTVGPCGDSAGRSLF